MENKVKNFEEYLGVNEGMFGGAEWVDLELLQGTIERMRSDEYKKALADLNSEYPMNPNVKIHLPGDEKEPKRSPEPGSGQKFNAKEELDKNHPSVIDRIFGK